VVMVIGFIMSIVQRLKSYRRGDLHVS